MNFSFFTYRCPKCNWTILRDVYEELETERKAHEKICPKRLK